MILKSLVLIVISAIPVITIASEGTPLDSLQAATEWQKPPHEIMEVLHAPQLPMVWIAPTGEHMVLAEPILYPHLAEFAAPMHKLAGMRVNPANNGYHGQHGGTSPYLVHVNDGITTPLNLPEDAEVYNIDWTVDGQRFALTVGYPDRIELWTGSVDGNLNKIENIALNPLMGRTVTWLTDPKRIGVIGHSHGGLMVANLLAHTDLFQAGIARSGSYNKTNQPFGFQSERRSLFEARDAYIQVSPTFFADQVNEPILIIHGNDDSNPGTLTFQSEVFYEAVRGSGGTARLILLPFEDHGYRARESVEHVIWEQLRWFDKYIKTQEP